MIINNYISGEKLGGYVALAMAMIDVIGLALKLLLTLLLK